MSDHFTIAFVTAALHDIVQAAVQDVAPGVVVRVGPPQAPTPGEKEVNLYLYHLVPNAQLRNADLPTRDAAGELVARPQVAIDLHYLISFSSEDHLATELMLGKVLTALHAAPVLTGDELRRTVGARSAFAFLRDSDLPRQLDRIKIIPQTLSLDELAKLWTVFFQIAHRPSLQYIASAVLLDAEGGPVEGPRRARSAVAA
ncbi:DUF4255 domain-containing protein [Sphingomonas bacterium]|uniref:DUF4255 domain-containing protein n=1 Tax=Sphingomonas bacterium TaxID=1895847 RepID=UPI0026058CA4|nr:DUF4255 domain-containing protein [Sphingomonas bacterium]MDB5678838.1 hypothetical protein [Sphingomonas bacterium]